MPLSPPTPPAVSLLRSIFRAHRQLLPPSMRALGDSYVRNEFRLHQKVDPTDTKFLPFFMKEWQKYLKTIREQAEMRKEMDRLKNSSSQQPRTRFGKQLEEDGKIKLNDEQKAQLQKLKAEVDKAAEEERLGGTVSSSDSSNVSSRPKNE